jgi:hypothetical protein
MIGTRAAQTRVFAVLVVLFAACTTALIAHVAIDVAGDVLLAHDTYDDLAHHSRGDVSAVLLAIGLAAIVRLLWTAVTEACFGRIAQRIRANEIVGSTPWRFVAATAILSVGALVSMELLDVVTGGGRIDDAGDLLGGSLLLGVSTTLAVGVLVAFALRAAVRLVTASQRTLVHAFVRLIALLTRLPFSSQRCARRRLAIVPIAHRSILSHRAGKRGPPPLLAR